MGREGNGANSRRDAAMAWRLAGRAQQGDRRHEVSYAGAFNRPGINSELYLVEERDVNRRHSPSPRRQHSSKTSNGEASQVIFIGIEPKKSRLPMSTPQWRKIA
jgi:hypothetical protein